MQGAPWTRMVDLDGVTVTHHNYVADSDDTGVVGLLKETATMIEEDAGGTYVVRLAEFTAQPSDLTSVDTRNTITDAAGDIWDVDDVKARLPQVVYAIRHTPRRHYGNYNSGGNE